MSEQRGGSMLKLERMRTAFDRAFRNEQNENLQKIEEANNVLESKMDSLISGEIDNVALQTDIEQKLNVLEAQYAPKLTEVSEKLDDTIVMNSIFNFNSIKYIAHRGAATFAPENTIPAFEISGKSGYWGSEADINCTSDGYWVVIHDATVDAMTDGTGNVSGMTLSQIKSLTIDSGNNVSDFPGTKIPTLDEYIEVCSKHNIIPVIEVKAFKNRMEIESLINIVSKYNLIDKCIIISSLITALQEIREINRSIALGWVAVNYDDSVRDTLLDLGNSFLNMIDSSITLEVVNDCHAHGLKVGAWTVNNHNRRMDLINMGVDIITTDKLI